MIKIINKNKFPVPVLVKSDTATRAFTTKNIPGIGAGQNFFVIPDEKMTDQIEGLRRQGLITLETRYKQQGKEVNKGE